MERYILITLDFPPNDGGVGRMYQSICRAMDSDEIEVLAPPPENQSSRIQEPYKVSRVRLWAHCGWPKWWPALLVFYKTVRKNKKAIVLVGQILPLGIVAWLVSWVSNFRYGVFIHGMDLSCALQVPRRRWLMRHIFARAEAVLAANQNVAGLAENFGAVKNKIFIVYPPVSALPQPSDERIKKIYDEYRLSPDEPILLTVARLVERKGIDIVLRALELVWLEYPNLCYFIIGEGESMAQLKALKATSSKPNQVKFLGRVTDESISAWLKLANIFIMTPKTLPNGDIEGLGMVFLEAGSAGLPVIGSKHGGVAEVIKDGDTGLLVKENDIKETAQAILSLLKDPTQRRQVGERGKIWVRRNFTAEKSAQSLRQAFNRPNR